jgi:hypothetical protein
MSDDLQERVAKLEKTVSNREKRLKKAVWLFLAFLAIFMCVLLFRLWFGTCSAFDEAILLHKPFFCP